LIEGEPRSFLRIAAQCREFRAKVVILRAQCLYRISLLDRFGGQARCLLCGDQRRIQARETALFFDDAIADVLQGENNAGRAEARRRRQRRRST
jgi:hypothetical protein